MGNMLDKNMLRRVKEKKTYLVFAFEHKYVGDTTEGDTQVNDLHLSHVVGNVTNMYDARRFSNICLHFSL